MAIELFGFKIGASIKDEVKIAGAIPSFVPPENIDAAVDLPPGWSQGLSLDLEGAMKTEIDLINKYRDLSLQPEVEKAVEDIVNEAIVVNKAAVPVEINLDKTDQPDNIKTRIKEEFDGILKLLNFQNMCYDIFRRWYVDGRLYYHIMVDEKWPRDGIKELRYIDPRRMRKVREPYRHGPFTMMSTVQPRDAKVPPYQEFYYYKPQIMTSMWPGQNQTIMQSELKVAADSICYVHSGLFDTRNITVLSFLHKAIKPMNQLRTMEDATVIYRLARAPERRVFYIDVGTMPKQKAEQYMYDIMARNKNRLVYDAATGDIRDDRKFMTMLEDYYLARREGGRGTEITTLSGGMNLGEMKDVEYFKKRLYNSLNVPISRMEPDATFNLGRASEITRDELKFAKFVQRLRLRFTHLFDNLLEIQLALKGVMRRVDWQAMRNEIGYTFQEDNFFAESKMAEIMNSRVATLSSIELQVGKYYSKAWVRRNVLQMTESDIKDMQREIDAETAEEKEKQADRSIENLGIDPETDQQIQDGGQVGPDGQQLEVGQQGPPIGQKLSPFGKKEATPKADGEDDFGEIKKEDTELSSEEKMLVENMTRALDAASEIAQDDL